MIAWSGNKTPVLIQIHLQWMRTSHTVEENAETDLRNQLCFDRGKDCTRWNRREITVKGDYHSPLRSDSIRARVNQGLQILPRPSLHPYDVQPWAEFIFCPISPEYDLKVLTREFNKQWDRKINDGSRKFPRNNRLFPTTGEIPPLRG